MIKPYKQQNSFDLYTYLIMIDILLLWPSLHFTTLHPTTLHSTCRHFTCWNTLHPLPEYCTLIIVLYVLCFLWGRNQVFQNMIYVQLMLEADGMPQAVSRRLLILAASFAIQRSVVDRVALGRFLSQYFDFPCSLLFRPCCLLIFILVLLM
jgi:hypothetical protein